MPDEYRSAIPSSAEERVIRRYPSGETEEVEYRVAGAVVGRRCFNRDGNLGLECTVRDGKKHGIEYTWHEGGRICSVEPYENGLPHGTAKQWTLDGRLMGTYTMVHGTGIDLWRCEGDEGGIYLSEVLYLKNGEIHGYNWWINEDQKTVHLERHGHEGKLHGIERDWDEHGRLRAGYPRYYVNDQLVTRQKYIDACCVDPVLPEYRDEDDSPVRGFPPEIAKHLRER